MQLLIIDDHPMTCAGLKSLLQGHYPEAVVDTLHNFNASVSSGPWDYLFLDMHLPGQAFHEVLAALGTRLQQVILISAYPEPAAVELARQRGVLGLLPKNIDIEHIIDGFQRIRHGERIFLDAQGAALPDSAQKPALTGRQNDILDALLGGLSNKQIARKYSISEYTVKEHVTAILAAYGVRNRLELLLQHRPPAI
ncbi:MAG: response regulator transcription factor [Pedobacter sp.]|nr:response regulator transcription factor [Pedobacter sp.]